MTENNTPRGFYYSVTDEQIAEHQRRSIREIFQWLEETNILISKLQTPEERERTKRIKTGTF
ncbi:MAG: hypothetical protein V4642_15425 [Bacteroidota bacterium]